ncbi:MAG TPA: SDR family oxidoreductase [Pirellulales bacterium]|jgi:nucleoside-diphosphate-sugar epimerase|nr:SDR family oxidoreductase [Pirellulales bacterium]
MSFFTILGGQGFIGSRLASRLRQRGHEVFVPHRDERLVGRQLGLVVYAIGVTSDFRQRPFDTVAAHVCRLNEVLRDCDFETLTYLSSTRVYHGLRGIADENSPLMVDPQRPDELYNISKLAGESLALASGRPTKIVRIANVYGPGDTSSNFLASVIREAATTLSVTLETAPESAKDYVAVDDVVRWIEQVTLDGKHRLYNLASGENVTHRALAVALSRVTGAKIDFTPTAPSVVHPPISTDRLVAELRVRPRRLWDELPKLVAACRASREPAPC